MSAVTMPLNHYLTEIPEKNAFKLKCKSFALNVLEKISWVAILAIMAVVFTVSYGGIVLTGNMPLIFAGMALSTFFFGAAIMSLKTKATHFAMLAETEGRVAIQLQKISGWKTPQIEQFLRDQGIDPAQIPLAPLKRLNSNEPLSALLPLIARFNHLKECAVHYEERAQVNLNKQYEDRHLQLESRQIGWQHHEQRAIPHALDAAILLQIMREPTRNLSITNLGSYRAKTFDERSFDRLYAPVNDNYFVFHPNLQRPPLTLQQVERDLQPHALHRLLFP